MVARFCQQLQCVTSGLHGSAHAAPICQHRCSIHRPTRGVFEPSAASVGNWRSSALRIRRILRSGGGCSYAWRGPVMQRAIWRTWPRATDSAKRCSCDGSSSWERHQPGTWSCTSALNPNWYKPALCILMLMGRSAGQTCNVLLLFLWCVSHWAVHPEEHGG